MVISITDDAKLSKVSTEANDRPIHGSFLCWIARIIALLPGIGATTYVWIDSVKFAIKCDAGWENYIAGIPLLCLLVLPGLIAWRWHLLGGIILAFVSAFNIFLIALSIYYSNPYLYLELEQYFVLHTILPFWVMILIGASLHLFVWWKERRSSVPRS